MAPAHRIPPGAAYGEDRVKAFAVPLPKSVQRPVSEPVRGVAEGERSGARAFWPGGAETLPSALTALARLMEADSIDLLHRSAESGAVRVVHRSSDDAGAIAVELPNEDEASFIAPRQAHWTTRLGDDRAVLLVKLMERRSGTIWAAIGYAGARAQVPDRVVAALPTFATLLVSHATTMVALSEARSKVHAVTAALDQHDCAVFIVKRDHTLLFANRTAQQLLGDKAGLQLSRSMLRPLGYQDAVRFETALDCVIDAAAARSDKAPATGMILLLPAPGQPRPMLVTIVPATQGGGAATDAGRAAAIISVLPADGGGDRGLEAICHLFGLSPVEVQLVRHLVAGTSVADAATRMRVKVDTARAYLKQVFAKTGTNKQAALIQLVTRYQRAVRGDFAYAAA